MLHRVQTPCLQIKTHPHTTKQQTYPSTISNPTMAASTSILIPSPKHQSLTTPTWRWRWRWDPLHPHKFPPPKMVNSARLLRLSSVKNSFTSNSSSSSSSNGYTKNEMKRVDSCLVFPPPKRKQPRAVVKFLGGAFIGAVSNVTYSYFAELLAKEGFLLVLVPYNVTFNHEEAARQVYERFNACLDTLLTSGLPDANLTPSQLAALPVFSVGHSNGALLQMLTGSYFRDKIPKANVVISFNNRPATEAVPYFEQLGPLVSQVMPMVETTPVFSFASSLSGDALKVLGDAAGAMISGTDPELASSVTKFADQLPSVLDEVRQGISEFRPTPLENRECFKNLYNVPHTLLVKFNFDAIDETDVLEETLRPRVTSIGGTLEKVILNGNHLTPCVQEPKWEVGSLYTPVDAFAQGIKTISLSDTKVLAQTVRNWLSRFE